MPDSLVVAISRYTAAADEVSAVVPEHRDWILGLYTDGVILASGPQEPRSGGVLLIRADSTEAARALVESDPLVRHGVAEYSFVRFTPTARPHQSPHLEAFFRD